MSKVITEDDELVMIGKGHDDIIIIGKAIPSVEEKIKVPVCKNCEGSGRSWK